MAKNAESSAPAELTTWRQAIEDPITQLLMKKDGVTDGHMYELAELVRERKAAASSRTR